LSFDASTRPRRFHALAFCGYAAPEPTLALAARPRRRATAGNVND
jgi:hypothetical protein